MQKILNNSNQNNYISKSLIGKYLYFKDERSDSYLYYIFTINNIELQEDESIIYKTNKCYMLYVPKNKELKAYVYDNYDKVTITLKHELYEMTFTEFVNTFRTFVNNDGKSVVELPTKLIQDYT